MSKIKVELGANQKSGPFIRIPAAIADKVTGGKKFLHLKGRPHRGMSLRPYGGQARRQQRVFDGWVLSYKKAPVGDDIVVNLPLESGFHDARIPAMPANADVKGDILEFEVPPFMVDEEQSRKELPKPQQANKPDGRTKAARQAKAAKESQVVKRGRGRPRKTEDVDATRELTSEAVQEAKPAPADVSPPVKAPAKRGRKPRGAAAEQPAGQEVSTMAPVAAEPAAQADAVTAEDRPASRPGRGRKKAAQPPAKVPGAGGRKKAAPVADVKQPAAAAPTEPPMDETPERSEAPAHTAPEPEVREPGPEPEVREPAPEPQPAIARGRRRPMQTAEGLPGAWRESPEPFETPAMASSPAVPEPGVGGSSAGEAMGPLRAFLVGMFGDLIEDMAREAVGRVMKVSAEMRAAPAPQQRADQAPAPEATPQDGRATDAGDHPASEAASAAMDPTPAQSEYVAPEMTVEEFSRLFPRGQAVEQVDPARWNDPRAIFQLADVADIMGSMSGDLQTEDDVLERMARQPNTAPQPVLRAGRAAWFPDEVHAWFGTTFEPEGLLDQIDPRMPNGKEPVLTMEQVAEALDLMDWELKQILLESPRLLPMAFVFEGSRRRLVGPVDLLLGHVRFDRKAVQDWVAAKQAA